jgi:hypothetical protein
MSLTPEIKTGVLLGRQALATWAFEVFQYRMPLRAPDMSLDISLLVVSDETPNSDGFESMAVGLTVPFG